MDDTDGSGWLVAGSTDPAEVATRYDGWATSYDEDLRTWSYRAPEIVAASVVERVPDASTVLDAGCGTGLVGRALRAAGYRGELHGVDISSESLRVAAGTEAYTTLATADLQRPLDLESDRFDAVVCVGVMTYVPDVEAVWREFARVVRPGGLVVVTQREDLWEPRRCQEVIDRLVSDGSWTTLEVTGPAPYLPDNTDGMASIGVYSLITRVA